MESSKSWRRRNIHFTGETCISVSHARRFGKSHAAGMIDGYYSIDEWDCVIRNSGNEALVHLGYLGYDADKKYMRRVPDTIKKACRLFVHIVFFYYEHVKGGICYAVAK